MGIIKHILPLLTALTLVTGCVTSKYLTMEPIPVLNGDVTSEFAGERETATTTIDALFDTTNAEHVEAHELEKSLTYPKDFFIGGNSGKGKTPLTVRGGFYMPLDARTGSIGFPIDALLPLDGTFSYMPFNEENPINYQSLKNTPPKYLVPSGATLTAVTWGKGSTESTICYQGESEFAFWDIEYKDAEGRSNEIRMELSRHLCPQDMEGEHHLRMVYSHRTTIQNGLESGAPHLGEFTTVYSTSDHTNDHPGGWGFDNTLAIMHARDKEVGDRLNRKAKRILLGRTVVYDPSETSQWEQFFYDTQTRIDELNRTTKALEGPSPTR
jgi:hypothetical protein